MDPKDLPTWLRENSSGVYRPAAQAADEIERLREIVGVLQAENERLRVMLISAQITASRDIDQMASDAIKKARAK